MRRRSTALATLAALAAGALVTGCAGRVGAVPTCVAGPRLATVAQAVPGAAYVPCIDRLAEGWTARGFQVERGSARFTLVPDRSGTRPVEVAFQPTCDVAGAVPTTPRADGVRTSVRLRSISPRYQGTMSDVFAGGCVTYRFDFPRGPHIALMEELGTTTGLFSRRELRLELHRQLGVELDP